MDCALTDVFPSGWLPMNINFSFFPLYSVLSFHYFPFCNSRWICTGNSHTEPCIHHQVTRNDRLDVLSAEAFLPAQPCVVTHRNTITGHFSHSALSPSEAPSILLRVSTTESGSNKHAAPGSSYNHNRLVLYILLA